MAQLDQMEDLVSDVLLENTKKGMEMRFAKNVIMENIQMSLEHKMKTYDKTVHTTQTLSKEVTTKHYVFA